MHEAVNPKLWKEAKVVDVFREMSCKQLSYERVGLLLTSGVAT